MSAPSRHKRRIKLIKPGLQLRLTLVLLGFCTLALLMQALLFLGSISRVALLLPTDGSQMIEAMSAELLRSVLLACGLCLPAILAVGILTTFRFAGPLYRFEQFLRAVQRGERPDDCRLRGGDELHDFCELLNEVTRPLRQDDEAEGTAEPPAVHRLAS